MRQYSLLVNHERYVVLMEKSCVEGEWNPIATFRSINQARKLCKILNSRPEGK